MIKVGDRVWFTSPNDYWRKYSSNHCGDPARIGGRVQQVSKPDKNGNVWVDFRFDDGMYGVAATDELRVVSAREDYP